MLNPWRRAAEAERQAAIAVDRAAFLEQELHWLRQQFEQATEAKDRANKIVANVFGQFHGVTPFPDVAHIPEPKDNALPEDFFETPMERPRNAAMEQFVEEEMQRAFPNRN